MPWFEAFVSKFAPIGRKRETKGNETGNKLETKSDLLCETGNEVKTRNETKGSFLGLFVSFVPFRKAAPV
jgi:hypothetical protein